ncbi:MAG: hypothetical protein V3S27_01380, partial [Kiloniellales bacterium]
HLNYFTPGTLRAAAEACGFRVRFGLTFRLPTSDNMYAVLSKASAPGSTGRSGLARGPRGG